MKKELNINNYLIIFFSYLLTNIGILLFLKHYNIHYLISITTSFTLSFLLINYICLYFYKITILKRKKILLIPILLLNIIIIRYYLVNNPLSKKPAIIVAFITSLIFVYLIDKYNNKKKYFNTLRKKTINFIKKIDNLWNKFLNLKIIKPLFKFLPNNLITFILFIISLLTIINFCKYQDDYFLLYSELSPNSDIGQITKPVEVKLDEINLGENEQFTHICFKFGTYKRINNSHYNLLIKNDNDTLYNKNFNAKNIVDGKFKCFKIGNISLNELKNYNITINPSNDVKKSNALTLFNNNKNNNLAIGLAKKQSNNINIIKYILIIIVIAVFLVINYIINKKELKTNKFLLICFIYMFMAALIIPAFQVPDEVAHFYKSYGLSQLNINNGIYKGLQNSYLTAPSNISCLNYTKIQTSNKVLDSNDIKKCAKETKNKKTYFKNVGTSSLLGYVVQSTVIKIIDFFSNSPLIIFYFGRLIMLITSFAICYYAIKITPKYKNLFLLVCTMMMFIQQIISYSYDSILNSICILYIAYMLNLIYSQKEISIKDYLIVSTLLVFILNIKIVYFPLIIFMFIIPKNKFKESNKKSKIKFIISSLILSLIIWKGFSFILNYGNTTHIESDSSINAAKQIKYLISNPISIFRIAINTFDSRLLFYLQGLTGFFGWFAFKIDDIYILIYILLFGYVIISEENSLNIKNRLLILLSIIISVAGIFAAMYIYWSDYKSTYVEGVQGRYFIPLLIPLSLTLIPKKKILKINNNIIYTTINILLLQFMLVLILWFY